VINFDSDLAPGCTHHGSGKPWIICQILDCWLDISNSCRRISMKFWVNSHWEWVEENACILRSDWDRIQILNADYAGSPNQWSQVFGKILWWIDFRTKCHDTWLAVGNRHQCVIWICLVYDLIWFDVIFFIWFDMMISYDVIWFDLRMICQVCILGSLDHPCWNWFALIRGLYSNECPSMCLIKCRLSFFSVT